jgi:hypothetical protein
LAVSDALFLLIDHGRLRHHRNQRTPLVRRFKGTSVVLMSMMVLGVIEGFTDTKADRSPTRLESMPVMEFQSLMEPLNSLAVSDAEVLESDRWYAGFSGSGVR